MENRRLKKIDSDIILCGALLCCIATFFWDLQILLGTIIGALLAVANWVGFRYLIARLMTSSHRVRLGILLALKTLAIFGIVSTIVLFAQLSVLAFVIGLSSLVCGIVLHTIRDMFSNGEPTLEEEF